MAKNFQITTVNSSNQVSVLHPETNADQVFTGTNTRVPTIVQIDNWNAKSQEVISARGGKASLKDNIDALNVSLSSKIAETQLSLEKNTKELKDSDSAISARITNIKSDLEKSDAELQTQIDSWKDFKNAGGSIGGNVSVNGLTLGTNNLLGQIKTNKKLLAVSISDQEDFSINFDADKKTLSPSVDKGIGLGSKEEPWKDIYLDGYSSLDNGYTKLPNGLIMQWGVVRQTSASQTSIKVLYPTPFKNKVYNITATGSYINSKDNVWTTLIEESTLDSFECFKGNNSSVIDGFCWTAIGY